MHKLQESWRTFFTRFLVVRTIFVSGVSGDGGKVDSLESAFCENHFSGTRANVACAIDTFPGFRGALFFEIRCSSTT